MKWIHILLTDQRSCPSVANFDISNVQSRMLYTYDITRKCKMLYQNLYLQFQCKAIRNFFAQFFIAFSD